MKVTSDHEAQWRNLFDKQQSTMEEAALTLLYRQEDPKEVLCSAINHLKNRPFDEVFGPICAVREVIKAAIARNDEESEETALAPQRLGRPGPLPSLPWAERAVYFLLEVQHYARRDTGLLLGMSDWDVDQLRASARKRLGFPEEPPKHEFRGQAPITSIKIRRSIACAAYE